MVDKGVKEEETKDETGINLDLRLVLFLILALNLLSIVSFKLRFEVLIGPQRLLNFRRELTNELPPNFPCSLNVCLSNFAIFLDGLETPLIQSLFSNSLSMKDRGEVTFSFFLG